MTRDHRPTFLIASYPGISGIAGVFLQEGAGKDDTERGSCAQ